MQKLGIMEEFRFEVTSGHLDSNLLLKPASYGSDQVAQAFILLGLLYLEGQRLHNLSGTTAGLSAW